MVNVHFPSHVSLQILIPQETRACCSLNFVQFNVIRVFVSSEVFSHLEAQL